MGQVGGAKSLWALVGALLCVVVVFADGRGWVEMPELLIYPVWLLGVFCIAVAALGEPPEFLAGIVGRRRPPPPPPVARHGEVRSNVEVNPDDSE